MSNDPRAPTVRQSVEQIETRAGPRHEHFEIPKDLGLLYRWELDSLLTPDHFAVLDHQGGEAGNWILVRTPDEGDILADADATIVVGGKRVRRIPVTTALRTYTLGTTNAAEGDWILLPRPVGSAFTCPIVNGGPAAGVLTTFPITSAAWALFYFDGTNWGLRSNALMF